MRLLIGGGVRVLLQRNSALGSSIKSHKALVSIIFPSLTNKSLVDTKNEALRLLLQRAQRQQLTAIFV
jgi:hypothetical protein